MEGVSVVTCTMRSHQMENIFINYDRQTLAEKELIIILNKDDMNHSEWKRRAFDSHHVSVYKQSQNKTLGTCLNFAIQKASYPLIAKMDDDDYYAPKYLQQAVQEMEKREADIVGKMSVTTFFEGENLIAIRKPGHENEFLNEVNFGYPHLGGGTMVWKKNLIRFVRFRNRNIGEDVLFQMDCFNKGFQVYSTSKNQYVSIRREDKTTHTWRGEDEEILKDCEIIGNNLDYQSFVEE